MKWILSINCYLQYLYIIRLAETHDLILTIHTCLYCRSTADLEGFHQHILMYCSKRFSYSPPVYRCRNVLAVLDHNMSLSTKTELKGKLEQFTRNQEIYSSFFVLFLLSYQCSSKVVYITYKVIYKSSDNLYIEKQKECRTCLGHYFPIYSI